MELSEYTLETLRKESIAPEDFIASLMFAPGPTQPNVAKIRFLRVYDLIGQGGGYSS